MANILFDVGHPAHVHLFKHVARQLEAQGHSILFSALDREMILTLLDRYGFPYEVTFKRRKSRWSFLIELPLRGLATYRIARRFRADLFVSIGSVMMSVPACLMGKPSIALTDTEHATEQHLLFKPFASVIATPSAFRKDMGPKQRRYPGYHELAYLHPDEFTPDPAELEPLGLTPESVYFIVRFVAWKATHDIGQHGFTLEKKRELLRELAAHGRILLSVEDEVDPEFAPYVVQFAPEKIHHLLAYASLYIGEGATMATESAVLGTPAIYVSTLEMGNFLDLQNEYGLLYWCTDGETALSRLHEILALPDPRQEWQPRRAHMLSEKIDVTPWLVDLCNEYL